MLLHIQTCTFLATRMQHLSHTHGSNWYLKLKSLSGTFSSCQRLTSVSQDIPTRVAGYFRLSRSSPTERWHRRGSGSRSCTPPLAQLWSPGTPCLQVYRNVQKHDIIICSFKMVKKKGKRRVHFLAIYKTLRQNNKKLWKLVTTEIWAVWVDSQVTNDRKKIIDYFTLSAFKVLQNQLNLIRWQFMADKWMKCKVQYAERRRLISQWVKPLRYETCIF